MRHNPAHANRSVWIQGENPPESGNGALAAAIKRVNHPVYLVQTGEGLAASNSGTMISGESTVGDHQGLPLVAYAPPLPPANLGSPEFKQLLGIRYNYVCGAMANGITSVPMVREAGLAGMIGFFGAAGLSPGEVETAIHQLKDSPEAFAFGFNLIHSPNDQGLEWEVVNLYLKHQVEMVSASAYLDLSLPLVYYRLKGLREDGGGNVICANKVIAKVSRTEVAAKFMSPPHEKWLTPLLEKKLITEKEAVLARRITMADAVTAEADSGGHTDNRPALALLPAMLALRDEMRRQHGFDVTLPVGLGGGIATPDAAAAAFAMGAAYVLTGSVNQSCVEAGTSLAVKKMLAEAQPADVTMAPAADMFEMGVKVQVLKRGTMFALRAAKLYDLYRAYDSFEAIPDNLRIMVERDFLKQSFAAEWEQTQAFFLERDPSQITRAEQNARHKMALVFRSYLGRSSGWAVSGEPSRIMDYQVWCGPAMGAFNQWVKGSFLEQPENRTTVAVAKNLLLGAAVMTRAHWLRSQGVPLDESIDRSAPMTMDEMSENLESAV